MKNKNIFLQFYNTILAVATVFIFIFGIALPLMAQPIHGHPQKASYANPTEWPTISAQGHWVPSDNPPTDALGHTHVDLHCPFAAEVSIAFICDFSLKLFHVAGEIKAFRSEFISNMVFDNDSTIQVNNEGVLNKPLKGDKQGLVIWTGHLTIDPNVDQGHPAPPRGWFAVPFGALTFFDNGDTMLTRLWFGFYSVKNPSAPETEGFPFLASRVDATSARHPEIVWGTDLVDYYNHIPLLPIEQPWFFTLGTAAYGGKDLPPTTVEMRADLDLHMNIPGRILHSITGSGDINPIGWSFDPVVLGSGKHKVAFIRTQPDQDDLVASLLVFDIPVGTSIPPVMVTVPSVVGQLINQAVTTLANAKLSVGSITTTDNTAPIDQVISQSPISGTSALQGSVVNLVKSTGPVSTADWINITPTFQKLEVVGQPTRYRICEAVNICKEIQ